MTISTLSQYQRLMFSSNQLRDRQLDLQQQIGTGYKARVFSGLGNDATRSLDIRSKLSEMEVYKSNIAQVRGRTGVMDTVMVQVSEIARNIQKELIRLDDNTNDNTQVVNAIARQGLQDIGQLLNTQLDGRYLFGGSATGTPPVNMANGLADAAEGIFDANFPSPTAANDILDGIFNQVFEPAEAYTPPSGGNAQGLFNSDLAEGDYRVSTRVDQGFDVTYGSKADAESIRQIIFGIAVAASIEFPADPADEGQYLEIVRRGRAAIENGVTQLDQEIGILGSLRNRMEMIDRKHDAVDTLLRGTLGEVEDADVADAATKLRLIETQLQATYSIIGNQSRFSLVDFLT